MAKNTVILFFVIASLSGIEGLLLQPQKRCVPTSVVKGRCHACVCDTDGVYNCREQPCESEGAEDQNNSSLNECEPNRLYRLQTFFCTCTNAGQWRSENCKLTYRHLTPKRALIPQKLRSNIVCERNKLYLVDCNICQCEANGYIEYDSCTSRRCKKGHKADSCKFGDILRVPNELCACSNINYYIDRLCLKVDNETTQMVNKTDVESIIDLELLWRRVDDKNELKCDENATYIVDCNMCVCKDNKFNCTTKFCGNNDKVVLRNPDISEGQLEFHKLPELFSDTQACKPGIKYRYKCNTCVCTNEGTPSCTTMLCLEDFILDPKSLGAALLRNP